MFTRAIFALLLILVAQGVRAREATPAELAGTNGFVRVSLPQWLAINDFVLRNTQTKKTIVLKRQPEDGPYSYGAWLPVGEYEIADTHGQDGERYDPILIRASEITDLGAVLKIQLGGYEYVWLPLQNPEAARARLGAVVKNVISWRPAAPPQPIKTSAPDTHLLG